MKSKIHSVIIYMIAGILFIPTVTIKAQPKWKAPFDTTTISKFSGDELSFEDVLKLTAANNPILKALDFHLVAVEGEIDQARLWPNPELSVELEEFGWDAPGFSESELTIALTQQLDLFGVRDAQEEFARRELDAAQTAVKQAAFDLYLELKGRYYQLAHAQELATLFKTSVSLAQEIVDNINHRLERGAALRSELLLAELELQKVQLDLTQAEQTVLALENNLVALWGGKAENYKLSINREPDFESIANKISTLSELEKSREVLLLNHQLALKEAEQKLSAKETKPALVLSGGFKRLEYNNSHSFLVGLSLPLPFFNRNQGEQQKIKAQIKALEYTRENVRTTARGKLDSDLLLLNQIISRHHTLDSLLLPTSEKAYRTLQQSYEAGRVPYTQLLEAERTLNDLSFEHNDMLLAIQEKIIMIEAATGILLRFDKEK